MGGGRLAHREVEAATRARRIRLGQDPDDLEPVRIAQRVQDG
jgi:hypothetical protein